MAVNIVLNLPNNYYNKNNFLANGKSINEILENLCNEFPLLKKDIFDDYDNVHPYLRIFLNNENINNDNLSMSVNDGNEIFIFCAIKGG